MQARQRYHPTVDTRKYLPFPLMHPACSMREAVKHMIMLEDHLFHPAKRCPDCIHKHFLAIEGFLEEAVSLCTDNSTDFIPQLLPYITACLREFHAGTDCMKIALFIRKVRKELASVIFRLYQ